MKKGLKRESLCIGTAHFKVIDPFGFDRIFDACKLAIKCNKLKIIQLHQILQCCQLWYVINI